MCKAKDAPLGYGQGWTAVTRAAASTSHLNSSGRPIMLNWRGNHNNNPSLQISHDEVNWVGVGAFVDADLGWGSNTHVSAVIPKDHYYRVSGALSSNSTAELR